MISFYEMQKRICAKFSFDITDMTDTQSLVTLDLIKSYINMAQEYVYRLKMPWMEKEGKIVLKASYDTGTITATKGSKTITGSETAFVRAMEGQKIVITDGTDGAVVYRLKSFVSATTFTLDCEYIHTGGAGLSYVIYYDVYTLPEDFKTLEIMKDVDVLTTYMDDDNYLLSSSVTTGVPTEMKFLGPREKAYYETGTVAVTKGATTVTGTDTAFDSAMVGRDIQIGTYGKLYEITAVASTTSLTIGKGFGGDTVSGAKFKIDPPGLQQVRFHSTPSVAKIIPYIYWPKSISLQDDEDISPIPNDFVLVLGGIWLWYKNEDSQLTASAKSDFDNAIAQMSITKLSLEQLDNAPIFS